MIETILLLNELTYDAAYFLQLLEEKIIEKLYFCFKFALIFQIKPIDLVRRGCMILLDNVDE